MVISIQDKIGFICEHKVWSNLSINQINKYKGYSDELGNETYYTVLITANRLQHTQEADIKLTWAEVGIFIEGIIEEYENEEKFVLLNFVNYLKEQGLWKYEKISMSEITSYYSTESLESKLDKLFEDLMMVEWDKECPNIKTFTKSSYNPKYNKYRWGRKGIDFFEQWEPGLFAGVMLDPKDHKITISDKDRGPDLVVILDIERKPNKSNECISSEIINSTEYKSLLEELKTIDNGFEQVKSKNKWRLAIIRKPLIDVLDRKYTNDEQLDAIKNAIVDGINILTNIKLS